MENTAPTSEIRVMIVDRDAGVRQTVRRYAESEGFVMDEAADGITALKLFRRRNYHIIILDRDLPELAPWHVCRQIRKNSETPIIIISSHSTEEEKLLFFDAGVDDYISKPFSCRELVARMRVILRHMSLHVNQPRRLVFEGLCIDVVSRSVSIEDELIPLSPKEYRLLEFFAQNPGHALTREIILSQVWGEDFYGTDRTVDSHVKSLRAALGPYQSHIATVWGYGYIFNS